MRTACGLGLIACLAATPAAAQQRHYISYLRAQVQRIETVLADSGYRPVGNLEYGTLNAGDRETRQLRLTLGTRYIVAGVCDQDCTNVDLRLAAPDGAELAKDDRPDDKPTLSTTSPGTGQFSIMVTMTGCKQSPCYWGFQVFEKR